MRLDKEQIKSILPQQEPFLFIDEVTEIDEGECIVAKKYVDPTADFFKGHFPGNPIMPGVLILEAMGQATILLYYTAKPAIANKHPDYHLTSINAKFKSPVYPGDTLILEARSFKIVDIGGVADVTARVGDKIVATLRGSFMVMPKKEPELNKKRQHN